MERCSPWKQEEEDVESGGICGKRGKISYSNMVRGDRSGGCPKGLEKCEGSDVCTEKKLECPVREIAFST